jgi:hypothetical protein
MLSSLVLAAAVTVPTYPGATSYCSQHVLGAPSGAVPGPSISWTAYYTSEAPEIVAAWYQRRLPDAQHRKEGREDIWRLPADQPEAVVSVSAVVDAPPPLEACKQRVPAKARTLILLSTMTRPAGAAPSASARQVPQNKPVRRSFPSAGITKLVLRAGDADSATVTVARGATSIDISGVPSGGAQGYHSPDPNWRETPASEWGLDFVAEARGAVLIVSTKNEVSYMHHRYRLVAVTVQVPPGVEVVKERRELNNDSGKPDLH